MVFDASKQLELSLAGHEFVFDRKLVLTFAGASATLTPAASLKLRFLLDRGPGRAVRPGWRCRFCSRRSPSEGTSAAHLWRGKVTTFSEFRLQSIWKL